mmetsp:Transcript_39386/g.89538  ORF Transcript_39386/g.89538 Transcript_39386/m.89538 type:complete len:238 (+) Transcript_39386:189-902(+)
MLQAQRVTVNLHPRGVEQLVPHGDHRVDLAPLGVKFVEPQHRVPLDLFAWSWELLWRAGHPELELPLRDVRDLCELGLRRGCLDRLLQQVYQPKVARVLVQALGDHGRATQTIRYRGRCEFHANLSGRQPPHGRYQVLVLEGPRVDLPAPASAAPVVAPELDSQWVRQESGRAPDLHQTIFMVLLADDLALFPAMPTLHPRADSVGAVLLAPTKGLKLLRIVYHLHGELSWAIVGNK